MKNKYEFKYLLLFWKMFSPSSNNQNKIRDTIDELFPFTCFHEIQLNIIVLRQDTIK